MDMTENEYGRMRSWMEWQQRRIVELESENLLLRRQLDALRRGFGVSVVIQGTQFPLAPLPALNPPSPLPAGQWSASIARQPSLPEPSLPPLAQPVLERVANQDDGWLTGQMRAVRAPVAGQLPVAPERRTPSVSRDITPTWLRDEDPRESSPRRTLTAATDQHPALRPQRHAEPPAPRERVSSRPLSRQALPKLEAVRLPTLAELTGRQPAIRGTVRSRALERTEFSDSFVLG